MYDLIWNGEVIDTAETYGDAVYLQNEYTIAYGGMVTISGGDE